MVNVTDKAISVNSVESNGLKVSVSSPIKAHENGIYIAVSRSQRKFKSSHIKMLSESIQKHGYLPTHPVGYITIQQAENYGVAFDYITKVDNNVGEKEWLKIEKTETTPTGATDDNTIIVLTGNHRVMSSIIAKVNPYITQLSDTNIGANIEGYIADESGSSEPWNTEDLVRNIGYRADCAFIKLIDEKVKKSSKTGTFNAIFAYSTITEASMPTKASFKKINTCTTDIEAENKFIKHTLKLDDKGVKCGIKLYNTIEDSEYSTLATQSRFFKAIKSTYKDVTDNHSKTRDNAYEFYTWLFKEDEGLEFAKKMAVKGTNRLKEQKDFEAVIKDALEAYNKSTQQAAA